MSPARPRMPRPQQQGEQAERQAGAAQPGAAAQPQDLLRAEQHQAAEQPPRRAGRAGRAAPGPPGWCRPAPRAPAAAAPRPRPAGRRAAGARRPRTAPSPARRAASRRRSSSGSGSSPRRACSSEGQRAEAAEAGPGGQVGRAARRRARSPAAAARPWPASTALKPSTVARSRVRSMWTAGSLGQPGAGRGRPPRMARGPGRNRYGLHRGFPDGSNHHFTFPRVCRGAPSGDHVLPSCRGSRTGGEPGPARRASPRTRPGREAAAPGPGPTDRGTAMPRLSLAAVLPPLLVAILIALFVHRWTADPPVPPPPATTAAAREAAGLGPAGSDRQAVARPSRPRRIPPRPRRR